MLPAYLKSGIEKFLSGQYNSPITIQSFHRIGGGCINDAGKITTNFGSFFIKWNDADLYPGMFAAEAKGLNLLDLTQTIQVPKIVGHGESQGFSFIIVELVIGAPRANDFWEHMGESLANLHQHTVHKFGLDHDNYIGSLRQFNSRSDSWSDFFVTQRLEVQLKLAVDKQRVGQEMINTFGRFYKMVNQLFPVEPPALIHGDLWSGNFIVGQQGHPCFVDPATYYGHREMELAFTTLFGGFDDSFLESYNHVYPLEAGFYNRIDYYNLYPLMVHANLFGGTYINSVKQILKRF